MAILGASFQVGGSALAAYRAAITITGQNIANVGNADYTRQSGRLAALHGGLTPDGIAPGVGVNLAGLQRHIDEAVEARLRAASGARAGAETTHRSLTRIESLYNELSEYDLSTALNGFFGSLAALQTDPLEMTARDLVVSSAQTLIATVQRNRAGVLDEIGALNTSAGLAATRANEIASEIARLNELIVSNEAGSRGSASALRDQRDTLLRELGTLAEIHVREHDTGMINVYIGSEPLVDFNRSRGLTTETVLTGGFERTTVRFADNNAEVTLRSGQLGALAGTRDGRLADELSQLDRLVRGIIYEVNRVHTSGQGLIGYTSLQATYRVDDPAAALNTPAAGLPFPVQNGSFLVLLRDRATGQTRTHMIEVDLDGLNGDDTTLTSLAADFDAINGLNATVTLDNRLEIKVEGGSEVLFGEDSSGALASLGLGTFFEGTDARTFAVRAEVAADARLLAASVSGAPGDGDNAGRMAAVAAQASALLGSLSILDFHEAAVSGLAVATAAAESDYQAADTIYSSLLAQRDAVSGVSLDEEAINLARFEQAFQAASRFLSVVNGLADDVLTLVR